MGRRCSRGSLDVQYNPMETLCKLFCMTCRGTTVHAEPMANVHRFDGYSCSLPLSARRLVSSQQFNVRDELLNVSELRTWLCPVVSQHATTS